MTTATGTGRAVVTAAAFVQLLAVGLWASGLGVLGAIVAPIVFRVVPAPGSADAMTLVFRRFDTVAITCAVLALAAEAALARRGGRVTRTDLWRGGCLVVASVLAILVGAWLSPGIAALHQGGAIRGDGAAGLELERLHRIAETCGKAQLALLAVAFFVTVAKLTRPATAGMPRASGSHTQG